MTQPRNREDEIFILQLPGTLAFPTPSLSPPCRGRAPEDTLSRCCSGRCRGEELAADRIYPVSMFPRSHGGFLVTTPLQVELNNEDEGKYITNQATLTGNREKGH